MRKRLLVGIAIAVLGLLFTPAMPATAHGTNTAVVAVFTGNAQVPGGLCAPAVPGCSGTATTYSLGIPGDSSPLPATCTAVGTFNGSPAGAGPCALSASGSLTAVAGVGPSCGVSHGVGSGTATFGGSTVSQNHSWITSAGGTIPITGTVGGHTLAALVQARPITPAGTIACVTTPAIEFIVAGVAVVQ